MNRRHFLIGGLGAGALAAAGYNFLSPNGARASATGVRNVVGAKRQMPIPPVIESVNERLIELTMSHGEFELFLTSTV